MFLFESELTPEESPVKADPSPENDVAAHAPVIFTPVDVVANFVDPLCFKLTLESDAIDTALLELDICCISSTF